MSRQAMPYLLQEPQGRGLPQARGRTSDEGRDVTECHVSVVRLPVLCVGWVEGGALLAWDVEEEAWSRRRQRVEQQRDSKHQNPCLPPWQARADTHAQRESVLAFALRVAGMLRSVVVALAWQLSF